MWCVYMSVCSQNPGMSPVDMVRDPRIGRLWTKYKETDLPVPKFKVEQDTQLFWHSNSVSSF